jgi:hypothetical protein
MHRNVRALLFLASIVLAAVVWLAFHDISEPHTVRDWLTLAGAVIVWLATALSGVPGK